MQCYGSGCVARPFCLIILVKIVLSVVATTSPSASGPICLPGPLARPSAALKSLSLLPALAFRASPAEAHDLRAHPKNSFLGGRDVVMLSRRFEPRALGKWTLHDTPCPSTSRLKPSLPELGYPCSGATLPQPVCPNHSLEPELLSPSPAVSVCLSSTPLCAVTAPEEIPLILCSTNGAPANPTQPSANHSVLKSIDFNEISIPVSELLLFCLGPPAGHESGLGQDLLLPGLWGNAWEEKGQRL